MPFFATKLSRMSLGLLIPLASCQGDMTNSLNMNDIKKEENMPLTRNDIPNENKWNVEALYITPEMWKEELARIKEQKWTELSAFKGRLHDPAQVAALFESYLNLQRKLEKLHTYAHLRMDEDLGNNVFKSGFGMISTMIHEFSLETSWIEPEFLSLDEKQFQSLLSDAALTPYRFYLEKVGRMRPHTLPAEQEALLALSGKALDTSYKSFGALNNADLTFKPALNSKGEECPVSNGSYLSYMKSSDRVLRENAFKSLHASYEAHANTICELLQGQVQSHYFVARARKFETCLDAALFPNQISKEVYTNLIQAVKARLPLMHEYVAFRKKVLNLPDIHAYDLYVPLIEEAAMNMSYEEGKEAVIASVAPMGTSYQESLRKGLTDDRWVDVYENARKRSGAYSSGCYDSMPYILMNYHGTLNDVLTLAHEAGHSMHSLLSRTNQPYIYSQYPIFVAEVASTFNEQLLIQHLKTKAKSKKDQAFLVNYQIEGIRGTIFRQTLFAEFELQLHQWAEEGVPFTPDLLNDYYVKLCKEYYGPDLVIDKELATEWARIPHFYYNFYVYQYATGLSASMALFQKAMVDEGAKKKYLGFLSSGGSKYPIDLLESAGVDMKKPDSVNAALDQFENLLKELKSCF